MNETFRDLHARFPALLSDYLLDVLDERQSSLIEAHARECDACGTLLAQARARRSDWWEGSGHAPVRLLSSWASAPELLPPAERALLERHLDRCDECREDARVLGGHAAAADVPAREGAHAPANHNSGLVWAFAGGLAAVLLVFVFMNPPRAPERGVAVQPEVRQPSESVTPPAGASGTPAPGTAPQAASGAAPVAVALAPVSLEGALRGAGGAAVPSKAARVVLPAGATEVPFTLPALFLDGATTVVAELHDSKGLVLWREELPAARALARAGIRIPAERFRAGTFVLRVAWLDETTGAESREYSLEVTSKP